MEDKKYFFFDIDGTLTDDATHQIVPSAQQTLQKLQENGHFVSIATGRAQYKTIAFANHIDIHNIVCFGGGCLVFNDEVIDMQYLPKEVTLQLIRNCEKDHVGYVCMLDDSDRVYLKDDLFLRQAGLRKELTTYIYNPKITWEKENILKVYVSIPRGEEDTYPWCKNMPSLRLDDGYVVYQYDAKDIGIIRMMEHFKEDISKVVVFGNDTNDMVMFRKEWMSIAMGNSPDVLKEKADFITKDNVDDGIAYACRHFGWIDE